MVVSQNEVASAIGAKVLANGGNAIDAAVAVGFALAVTLPRAGILALRNGADANWRDEPIPGGMPFFFRLSTPKTILMILTRKGAACIEYCTLPAHCSCHFFATLASLRSFGNCRH